MSTCMKIPGFSFLQNAWKRATSFGAKGLGMFCQEQRNADESKFIAGISHTKSELRSAGGILTFLAAGIALSAQATVNEDIMGMGGTSFTLVASLYQALDGYVMISIGCYMLITGSITRASHTCIKAGLWFHKGFMLTAIVWLIKFCMGEGDDDDTQEGSSLHIKHSIIDGMGVKNMLAVRFMLIGGAGVLTEYILALLSGRIVNKHRGYFICQYAIFGWILPLIVGLSQLVLGLFLGIEYGWHSYDAPVKSGYLTIYYSSIAVGVGAFQTIWALFGLYRYLTWRFGWASIPSYDDNYYLIATLITWLLTIILQVIVQTSYGDGMESVADGATNAAVYVGCFLMAAWADYKVRTTPSRIDRGSYSLPQGDSVCDEDGFMTTLFGYKEGQAPALREDLNDPLLMLALYDNAMMLKPTTTQSTDAMSSTINSDDSCNSLAVVVDVEDPVFLDATPGITRFEV